MFIAPLFIKLQLLKNLTIDLFHISILKYSQLKVNILKKKRFHQKLCELLDSKHVRLKSGHTVYYVC